MNKILTWILSFSKLGKVNESIKGYRAAAIALATALAATTVIIVRFTEKGLPYLATLMGDPEFQTATGGWIAFFAVLKGMRIEKKLDSVPAANPVENPK
jgi:hypothetical protein